MIVSGIRVEPVTRDRWKDLTRLFGPNGAYSGCWCMWWRQSSAEYERDRGASNRRGLKRLVDADRVPGLLAYVDDEPVGWVSVAPREEFGRLGRSPVLKPVDGEAVWSVVCFYIHRSHRRKGVGAALLDAAAGEVRRRGGRIVEGYPVETNGEKAVSASVFTGLASMFRAAGFREVARRKPNRPIMRRRV